MAGGPGAASVERAPTANALPPGLRLHGALDLGFAALYAWLGFAVVPGRARAWNLALGAIVVLLALAGAALLAGWRRARGLALATQVLLLGFAMTAVALVVGSVGYLRAIYGPLGRGMALLALVVAALVVELCGLLPLFQLRYLLRDDVRLHFRRGPAGSVGPAPGEPGPDLADEA